MMLIHYDYSFRIVFEEGYVNSLTVENNSEFAKLAEDFLHQCNGDKGSFVLSEDNKPVPISKSCELLSQFLPFESCRKTLVAKLYNYLKKQSVNEHLYLETQNLSTVITAYIEQILQTVDFSVEYSSDIDVTDIFKSVDLKIGDSKATLCEQLIDYFLTCYALEGEKLFVTVNLKPFFTDSELESFYSSIISHKIKLLMIENVFRNHPLTEKTVIIDNDLCEIY